ncbi:unnamed protein product [Sphagnum troendelagicum]|uniref:Uncharacterized protein n=1 Tax=Sphagnum troendelagicum TaxID=128251 RepID=A0ABP0V081_9BRYO
MVRFMELFFLQNDRSSYNHSSKNTKVPFRIVDKTVEQIEKALESMEDEAERIYRDEQLSLVEDEAAATRDTMHVQVEFVDGGEN